MLSLLLTVHSSSQQSLRLHESPRMLHEPSASSRAAVFLPPPHTLIVVVLFLNGVVIITAFWSASSSCRRSSHTENSPFKNVDQIFTCFLFPRSNRRVMCVCVFVCVCVCVGGSNEVDFPFTKVTDRNSWPFFPRRRPRDWVIRSKCF